MTPRTSCGPSTSASSTSTRGRCGGRTSTTPTSCASTSTPRPVWLGRRAPGRAGGARRARRARAARLPEDERLARASTSTSASRPSGRSPRCAGRRWRWPARSSGACPTGDEQVVEGGAPRRVRRLQPERARPHRGLGVLGAPDARRARLVRRWTWDEVADVDPRELRARHGARPPARGRRPGRRHRRARGLARRAARARRARRAKAGWATRRGRRTSPSSAGEPKRVQPSRDRDRPKPTQRPRRRSAAGRAARPGSTGAAASAGKRRPAAHGPGLRGGVRRRLAVELVDGAVLAGPCPRASGCSLAPWRMRPAETWSKVTSTTSSGRSATHSSSRPWLQRLGSPAPRSPVS